MIDFYEIFNKPEKLDMHFEYADSIDAAISRRFKYKTNFGPILHIIKRSYYYSYRHACMITKGRFIEAEPTIMKDPLYSYYYALHVIKDRWIEAEPIIMKSSEVAYWYARWIIKDRWIEAEPYITKDKKWWGEYNKFVLN